MLRLPDSRALYFAGDTKLFSDVHLIHQLYQPELAFLPIGDLFTMSPREAAMACELLRVKKVVPMHFGAFPPWWALRANWPSGLPASPLRSGGFSVPAGW